MKSVAEKLRKYMTRYQWLIAFRLTEKSDIALIKSSNNLQTLIPPKDVYWADPFPIRRKDRLMVFFEEYSYSRQKGHISCIEIGTGGSVTEPETVLWAEHHLAYPFTFFWNKTVYMIPDMSAVGEVNIYRCTDFPTEWTLDSNIIEGIVAKDPTVYYNGELWWLFVNCPNGSGQNHGRLCLYFAQSLSGPWQPHPKNPVKDTIKSGRPAGRLWTKDERLFRPSQDCKCRYGHRIRINEIKQLTRYEYREEEVDVIYPNWQPGLLGTHTLNINDGVIVVDGLRRICRY